MIERKQQIQSEYIHWSKHSSYKGLVAEPGEYPIIENSNFYRGKLEKDTEKNANSDWRKSLNKKQ